MTYDQSGELKLLATLGLDELDCGRFRGCYPGEEGEIIVETRTGAGNAPYYEETHVFLRSNEFYMDDCEDSGDPTYMYFTFRDPNKK